MGKQELTFTPSDFLFSRLLAAVERSRRSRSDFGFETILSLSPRFPQNRMRLQKENHPANSSLTARDLENKAESLIKSILRAEGHPSYLFFT